MLLRGFVFLGISSALSILCSVILNFFESTSSRDWWMSLSLYACISLCLHFIYLVKTDVRSYTGVLLGTISGKLIILLIFILLYFILRSNALSSFFIHFFVHYILFTVFEIRYLLQLVKHKKHLSNE